MRGGTSSGVQNVTFPAWRRVLRNGFLCGGT
jgi:hypothetical protein